MDGVDRQQLLTQLERHIPRSPRRIDSTIPKDLETIVLKATAARPEDRYGSAAELANDLSRYLENKTVLARRVTRLGHIWRWTLRHRLVASLTASLMLLLLTLAIVGPMIAFKYARLAADEARARRLSDANRQDLQRVLNDSLCRTAEVLGDQPGLYPVQKRVMREIVDCYDTLRARSGNDPSVQHEAAQAYLELARVSSLLFSRAEADPLYSRAIETLTTLNRDSPHVAEYQRTLVDACAAHGMALTEDDSERGLEKLRFAVSLIETIPMLDASDVANTRQNIRCRTYYGYALGISAAVDDAEEQLVTAVRLARQLHEADLEEEQDAFMWAYAQDNLANVLQMKGRFGEAESLLRSSLATYANLPEFAGTWIRGRSAHGDCKQKYSSVLNRLGRHREGEVAARDAIDHVQSILQGFPGMEWMQAVCDEAYTELAISLAAQERWSEAETAVRSGLAIWDVGDEQRQISRVRRGVNNYRLGLLRLWQGDDDAARDTFEASLRLLKAAGDNLLLARALSTCPIRDLRDTQVAVTLAQNALKQQDARRWQVLGVAQYRNDDFANARQSLLEAVRRRLNGEAYDYFFLSMCCQRLGDGDAAAEWYRKALEHLDRPVTPATGCFPTFPRELHDVHMEAEAALGAELDVSYL